MRLRILAGVGTLALMFTGCAGGPANAPTAVPPSGAPSSSAPVAPPSPSQNDEPQPAQIQWIDGSTTYADPDAGSKLFNFLGDVEMGQAPKVKRTALITDAKFVEKDGDVTFTLTVDDVTASNTGDEEGPGYTNPSKATKEITVTNPLLLVFPPNVVTPTAADFVSHLKEFDEPFSFYYDKDGFVTVVEWYHP